MDRSINKNIEIAIDKTLQLEKGKCRYDSVLRALLNCDLWKVSIDRRYKFLSLVMDDNFIIDCDSRLLVLIYKFLPKKEKQDYVKKLMDLSRKARFNSYHYHLLRSKEIGLSSKEIKEIHGLIQKLKL